MNNDHVYDMAQRFIADAQGTCASEYEIMDTQEIVLESYKEEQEFWSIVENSIFLCTQCGWWCESSEHSMKETNEFICTDCLPDDDDD